MIKVLIGDAIMAIDPDAQVTVRGDDIDTCTFEWDSSPEISRADIKAKMEAMAYIPKRQNEYPPITDYLDAIVKGDDTQKQKYIDDCKAVKEKYPK